MTDVRCQTAFQPDPPVSPSCRFHPPPMLRHPCPASHSEPMLVRLHRPHRCPLGKGNTTHTHASDTTPSPPKERRPSCPRHGHDSLPRCQNRCQRTDVGCRTAASPSWTVTTSTSDRRTPTRCQGATTSSNAIRITDDRRHAQGPTTPAPSDIRHLSSET
jgi:hypothetical protein